MSEERNHDEEKKIIASGESDVLYRTHTSNHIKTRIYKDGNITETEEPIPGKHLVYSHARIKAMSEEMHDGIRFVETFEKSVTFFGSARLPEDNKFYIMAQKLAHKIANELGYIVVSGGGPGIMEAANRGAWEAGGESVGLTIKLPMEQKTNDYVKKELPFHYFFTRKYSMTYSAEAYIYFPGGYGTLDELFEILTLIQTEKIPPVPVILVGSEFWSALDIFLKGSLSVTHETISLGDLDLYTISDDLDEITKIVREAPVRKHA